MSAAAPSLPTGVVADLRNVGVTLHRDDGAHDLVAGVSLRIVEGQTLALVGESGSGKTLTAACLTRLFGPNGRSRTLRARGDVLFRTRSGGVVDLSLASERELEDLRGREIGFIAQDPLNALNPTMRVADQAIEARRRHLRETKAAAREAIAGLFAEVGFADPAAVMPLYPHQLSGGMRQRAMIALALAAEPQLVVADEPTTALDVTIQAQVMATLARLQRTRRLALLLISHDLDVVARLAHAVAIMYCGRIVEQGPADAVLGRPAHPYTADLLASVPRLERHPSRLRSIDGVPADPLHRPPGCSFAPRCRLADAAACTAEVPLVETEAGRFAACVRPLRGPAGWGEMGARNAVA